MGARLPLQLRRALLLLLLATCGCAGVAVTTAPAHAMGLMTEDTHVFFGPASPLQTDAYAQAHALGVRLVRGLVARDATTNDPASPGSWQGVDAFVDATRAHGLQPYLTLTYRPADWGHPDTALPIPSEAEFASFCRAAAIRYRGRVSDYSVWNEPNGLRTESPAYDPQANPHVPAAVPLTAATYGHLYRACWGEIKAQDPSARVYFGELATGADSCDYVSGALSPSRVTYADGLAIHPYQFDLAPEQPYPDALCKGIGRLADWRAAAGGAWASGLFETPAGAPVPLMVTEFGYCAGHGECPERTGTANRLADSVRADWIARAYRVAAREGVTLFSYYHLVEQEDVPDASRWDTGIVRPDGAPTASVGAIQAVAWTQWLGGWFDRAGAGPAPSRPLS